jgi:hypothetical protein
MAGGGTVQMIGNRTAGFSLRMTESNGSSTINLPVNGVYFATPTTDGQVVVKSGFGAGGTVALYSPSGQAGGQLATGNLNGPYFGPAYPTPDGGFTVLTESSAGLLADHWSKVVPAYSPGSPLAGEVGSLAGFATAPGVAQGSSGPTPPSPPSSPTPVVTGSGPGASFGGVAGCNSAVCAQDVRGAVAIADAVRASANVTDSDGTISRQGASNAVAALARAQSRPISGSEQQTEEALVLRDYGQLERLVSDISNSLEGMSREEVLQQAQILKSIVSDFLEKEALLQKLGAYRSNPDDMDLVNALLIMNDEERAAFALGLRERQGKGEP